MDNDGSPDSPWSTLAEVIDHQLIESYEYTSLPYDALTSSLSVKNNGAPVKAGDTLLLKSGLHGNIFIRNYSNLDYITVMGGENEQPVLEQLHIQSGSKWKFENLKVSSEPYGNFINSNLVFFESHNFHGPAKDIEIYNCEVVSADAPWEVADDWLTKVSNGIYAKGDSINVINNEVRNVDMGISAVGDHINVVNNSIVNFSGDGLRILGSYGLFQGNLIKNCYNVDDNHDDGIQSFTTNGYVVDHNIVRGNTIINQENPDQPLSGPLQGIGCFDGMYNNWIIENNLIIVNHWHGITLLGAKDCMIINNTILDPSPELAPGGSWIMIADHKDERPSSGCIVKNNVANKFTVDGELGSNVVLNSITEYSDHFVDVDHIDFHLLASSSLIDSGEDAVAPMFDLNNIPRPQGEHVDIGCYEFTTTSALKEIIELGDEINIYPNPTNGLIHLDLSDFNNYSVKIIDFKGRQILQQKLTSNQIDISQFPSGSYFIKAYNAVTKQDVIYKVVKQ
ncbi:hypothetical protein GCM10007940_14290 [Portibacter lacus]|uniref:Secretion system C-terminal sorting domain-containing protein n=2 Tax=Portibacter lacus TaxID=1099794 RepID=A0AA37WEK0_9BACT|nr:hypothetical protein GCM10007940_14290 [Portibacter lacus]